MKSPKIVNSLVLVRGPLFPPKLGGEGISVSPPYPSDLGGTGKFPPHTPQIWGGNNLHFPQKYSLKRHFFRLRRATMQPCNGFLTPPPYVGGGNRSDFLQCGFDVLPPHPPDLIQHLADHLRDGLTAEGGGFCCSPPADRTTGAIFLEGKGHPVQDTSQVDLRGGGVFG